MSGGEPPEMILRASLKLKHALSIGGCAVIGGRPPGNNTEGEPLLETLFLAGAPSRGGEPPEQC